MAQYQPPQDQTEMPGTRSRGPSNASMNRYVPDTYRSSAGAPPPPPGDNVYYTNQPSRPRGPSFAGQPINSIPPVPNPNSYGGGGGGAPRAISVPRRPTQPQYPEDQGYYLSNSYPPPANVDRDGYMRPPADHQQRRMSATSTHSRRSQKSHHSSRHSHDSRPSHRSRRSSDHHHHDRRRSHDDRDQDHDHDMRLYDTRDEEYEDEQELKRLRRQKTRRPTIGDTVISAFHTIKDALGPRDKY